MFWPTREEGPRTYSIVNFPARGLSGPPIEIRITGGEPASAPSGGVATRRRRPARGFDGAPNFQLSGDRLSLTLNALR
jgi:hypothetical protein